MPSWVTWACPQMVVARSGHRQTFDSDERQAGSYHQTLNERLAQSTKPCSLPGPPDCGRRLLAPTGNLHGGGHRAIFEINAQDAFDDTEELVFGMVSMPDGLTPRALRP